MALLIHRYIRNTLNTPMPATMPARMLNCVWRALRRSSRQGSRLMRAMSVEAPQGESACHQQRRGLALHELGLGARGHLHLAEGVADHGRHAHLLGDALGRAGD